MAGTSCKPVKVVFIHTRYIETDPRNFKSVVQSLTGKGSAVEWMQNNSFVDQNKKRSIGSDGGHGHVRGRDITVSSLSNNLFSKDFDTKLSELPSMDDLYWLWAD